MIIEKCSELLKFKFAAPSNFHRNVSTLTEPPELIEAIDHLPVSRMCIEPLESLLEGFQIDLNFDADHGAFPIGTEANLDTYAFHVAGTVAICIVDLVTHHFPDHPCATDATLRRDVVAAAGIMGKALQYVNIARDISCDASINRCYLPTTWLKEKGLSPTNVIAYSTNPRQESVRDRVLAKASQFHVSSREAISALPLEVQGPIRVVVESYMEIGEALRRGVRPRHTDKKLKLSLGRRLMVAYRAMARNM